MRAWLLVCAALALTPCRATAAHAHSDPARLERIKSQILAKLGLSTRPMPLGAPPRDVVRQILARAADPHADSHAHTHDNEHAMREVIAIAQRDECSITCKGSPQFQQFAPGHKYNYSLEVTINFISTGYEKQNISISGQVAVTAIGNCAHELTIQNLVTSKILGAYKPIQFSLQDGRLGAEICTQEGETRSSLNFKRLLISLLQTGTKFSTQYDVLGTCPTEISHSQEGEVVLVHRFTDLSRCVLPGRGNNHTTLFFNPGPENILLQSSWNIDSKVNNSVLEEVSVAEEYMYRYIIVKDKVTRSTVNIKLILIGKSAEGAQGNCTVPRTIMFELPDVDFDASNNAQNARRVVRETKTDSSIEASAKYLEGLAPLFEEDKMAGE